MRLLCSLLVSLLLTGCLGKHVDKPESVTQGDTRPREQKEQISYTPSVRLFTNTSELASLPFHDLGQVHGDDCQSSMQDAMPSIPAARKKMLARAAAKKANAVLLHQCEVMHNSQGCYRQAICQGTALKVMQP
ncbi:MAG: Outer membrane lipoprotein RcsF [Candidatus Erwinia impunctatus]|nr:Outer membrane lipoprotein RcsF [Culicoides impunctatus]